MRYVGIALAALGIVGAGMGLRRFNALPPITVSVRASRTSRLSSAKVEPSGIAVLRIALEAQSCAAQALADIDVVSALLQEMARIGDFSLPQEVTHQSHPEGMTALLLAPAAHLGAHTWPERGYAALDVVSRKEIQSAGLRSMKAAAKELLRCGEVSGELSRRGFGAAGDAPAASMRVLEAGMQASSEFILAEDGQEDVKGVSVHMVLGQAGSQLGDLDARLTFRAVEGEDKAEDIAAKMGKLVAGIAGFAKKISKEEFGKELAALVPNVFQVQQGWDGVALMFTLPPVAALPESMQAPVEELANLSHGLANKLSRIELHGLPQNFSLDASIERFRFFDA